jgi:hypothetical protein
LEGVFGATFAVEPDPNRAAVLIRRHIESKRAGLGLTAIAPDDIAMPEAELALHEAFKRQALCVTREKRAVWRVAFYTTPAKGGAHEKQGCYHWRGTSRGERR